MGQLHAEIESLELRLMSSDGLRAEAEREASAQLAKELHMAICTLVACCVFSHSV